MSLKFFLVLIAFMATSLKASNSDPIQEETFDISYGLRRMTEIQPIILSVINSKKSFEDMTDKEKKFLEQHNIDASRAIKYFFFAGAIKDLVTGKIDKDVTKIKYFPKSVDKRNVINHKTSSTGTSFNGLQQSYGTYESNYKINAPTYLPSVPYVSKPQYAIPQPYQAPQPVPTKPRQTMSMMSGGQSITFQNGAVKVLQGDQFKIGDRSCTREEFEEQAGFKIPHYNYKNHLIDNLNINIRAFGEGCKIGSIVLGNDIKGATPTYQVKTDSGLFTVYDNNSVKVQNYVSRKKDVSEKFCKDKNNFTQHLESCGIKVQGIIEEC